jgi:hypothetical protein
VQTPCLVVGQPLDSTSYADELRLAWELIGNVDRDANEFLQETFKEGVEELGLCTFSSPQRRLLFDWPELPARSDDFAVPCNDGDGLPAFAFTTQRDDHTGIANTPGHCIAGHAFPEVVLEAFPRREEDPDGRCPTVVENGHEVAARFDGPPMTVLDSASACGMRPSAATPSHDVSYRLTLREGHSFGDARPERWLRPNVMFVNGTRRVVRPMADDGGGGFKWETPVSNGAPNDSLRQWAENYMPTVRVRRVEILSRDRGGQEVVETPADGQLTILVPRPSERDAVVTCTGSVGDDGVFSFSVPYQCHSDDSQALAVTPTYAPGYLDAARPLTSPIGWLVRLPGLAAGRRPFIRFSLQVVDPPGGALTITPARDFGRIRLDGWRQLPVVLHNFGGPDMEVRTIGFTAASAHSGDFSFVVAGDPVDVPLPIEARPEGRGFVLGLAPDAAEAPILKIDEDGETVHVSLGDPTRGPDTQALTLYGQPARLVGNLLLRDDPTAVMAPAAAAHPRPLSLPAFAERLRPFVLRPNESVEIVVTARPTAVGTRRAELRVDAVPIGNPSQPVRLISQVHVEAVHGPMLRWAPDFIYLGLPNDPGPDRWALIYNAGHFDLQVTRLSIVGAQASRFAFGPPRAGRPARTAPFTLAPGDFEDIHVVYTPECDGSYTLPFDHQASLVI